MSGHHTRGASLQNLTAAVEQLSESIGGLQEAFLSMSQHVNALSEHVSEQGKLAMKVADGSARIANTIAEQHKKTRLLMKRVRDELLEDFVDAAEVVDKQARTSVDHLMVTTTPPSPPTEPPPPQTPPGPDELCAAEPSPPAEPEESNKNTV